MLFALPIGLVPLAVAAGLVLRTVADRPWPLRDPSRALPLLAHASHALGPTLVIALAGGLPLRWSRWPIYLAALAAQFAFDFAAAVDRRTARAPASAPRARARLPRLRLGRRPRALADRA